jgi:hypothetical protein
LKKAFLFSKKCSNPLSSKFKTNEENETKKNILDQFDQAEKIDKTKTEN